MISLCGKRPLESTTSVSARPHKRVKHSDSSFVLHQNKGWHGPSHHQLLSIDPVTLHSAPVDAIRISPLQRAVALFSDASNNVADRYITSHPPHHQSKPLPSMISHSRRFLPYPAHKPSRLASSRSSLAPPTNTESPEFFDPGVFAIPDTFDFTFSHPSSYWGHISAAPQPNLCAQSGSPYSDDSVIATPVSERGARPFIQGEDFFCTAESGSPSWEALCAPDSKLDYEFQAAPSTVQLSIHETVPISHYSLSQRDNSTLSTHNSSSCSFATTIPQFVSPFSDSAVTASPQRYPLFAPRPVRPIPKVCFTPPEEDTLATNSLLYKPLANSMRQAAQPFWTNPWTRS